MFLVDYHRFEYLATVPFPDPPKSLGYWIQGVETIEYWLRSNVGSHYERWAWADSQSSNRIGVAFRYDQDRCLFVLTWDR